MSFKNLGQKNIEDRGDIEDTINRGIEIFNNTNHDEESIPLLNEYNYGIRSQSFEFEDDYILIKWERDDGRCGEEYLVNYEKKIPYEYFESNQTEIDIQDKIKADKANREAIKLAFRNKEKEINIFKKELSEYQDELRSYNKIVKKYSNDFHGAEIRKKIEREIIKCQGAIYIKEDELTKLKEEK